MEVEVRSRTYHQPLFNGEVDGGETAKTFTLTVIVLESLRKDL